MQKDTNLRNLVVTPSSGKDVKDTQQLSGMGKFTAAQNDTNDMKQYSTGAAPSPGKLGALPSGQ
jgi:hypothetical protein